jgi:hypothetical protein
MAVCTKELLGKGGNESIGTPTFFITHAQPDEGSLIICKIETEEL